MVSCNLFPVPTSLIIVFLLSASNFDASNAETQGVSKLDKQQNPTQVHYAVSILEHKIVHSH